MKIFSLMKDGVLHCNKEMENLHPRFILPQAATPHKGTHVHILPLAKICLDDLFYYDLLEGHTTTHWWSKFTGLLSALDHTYGNQSDEMADHSGTKVN